MQKKKMTITVNLENPMFHVNDDVDNSLDSGKIERWIRNYLSKKIKAAINGDDEMPEFDDRKNGYMGHAKIELAD